MTISFHEFQSLFEDKRVDTIIKVLQDPDTDPKVISAIESILKEKEIVARIDRLWEVRKFGTRMQKYKDPFARLLITTKTSLLSKIQFLFLLTSGNHQITKGAFTTNGKGDLLDLPSNKISNNETFKRIGKKLIISDSFRGKGIGPGEFFLALLGKDGDIVDDKGDVVLDKWFIEIKGSGGGSIKTGAPSSHRVADKLRDEMNTVLKTDLGRKNKLKMDKDGEFVTAMKKQTPAKRVSILNSYFKKMYPTWSASDIKKMSSEVASNLGTKKVNEIMGQYLLGKYKELDGWNSIMLIGKNGTSYGNISKVKNVGTIGTFRHPQFNRDGDTQALPDGYINLGLSK